MPEITLQLVLFILGVAGLTAAAAFWDIRERRIPNQLTLPVFGLGWLYQVYFNGLPGLADAGTAFLVGFGTLFVLWIVGGGGGGDVKLMGALSVWIGFHLTLLVLIVSTIVVIVSTAGVMVWSTVTNGHRHFKDKHLATGKDTPKGRKRRPETSEEKAQRRVMAYAVPVMVATWSVVIWKLPTFPW